MSALLPLAAVAGLAVGAAVHRRGSRANTDTPSGSQRMEDVFGANVSGKRLARLRQIAAMSDDAAMRLDVGELDRTAFGVVDDQIVKMPLARLTVCYPGDMQEAERRVALNPRAYARAVDTEPIDVSIRGDRICIEDGHHRVATARRMGRASIHARVSIKDNAILAIRRMARRFP